MICPMAVERTDYRKFLDPRVVSELKDLNLRARLIVEGFLIGLHRSPFHGFSVEFKEHRAYNPGDEIRWIDWKVYARTNRFYVRKFEEETNLKAYILFDVSKSMDFPEKGVSKFEYARSLAAALSYLFFFQKDAVGLLAFSDRLHTFVPPSASKANLHRVLIELTKLRPQGTTAPWKVFAELAERMKKRGLVILISDLYMEGERILKAMRNFRYRQHEVLVFQVLSPEDMNLPGFPVLLRDLETREEVSYDPDSMKAAYRKKLSDFVEGMKKELRKDRIDFELLTTDLGFERALYFYLKKREKLF